MNTVTLFLAFMALATATLSGIIGMGGGMLFLATLFCFLPHSEAVPLHAAVQLVSNGTRVAVFRKNVDWPAVLLFAIGGIPGTILASLTLWTLGEPDAAEPYLKIIIGLYILVLTFIPKPKAGEPKTGNRGFLTLGLAAGTLGMTVGAVGPLIAPIFLRRNYVKERLIATKAVCQMVTHAMKLPAFWILGRIEVLHFSSMLAFMIPGVILGTILGKRLLKHVSPESFTLLYKCALVAAGLKVLIVDGLMKLAP